MIYINRGIVMGSLSSFVLKFLKQINVENGINIATQTAELSH